MSELVAIGSRQTSLPRTGFDPAKRELTYVATTEAPCPAYREIDGKAVLVMEVLKVTGCRNLASIDGTPLLDCHKRDDLRDQLGRQRSARIEGDTIIATAVLSRREDVRALDVDFEDGVFNKVSVGYTVYGESIDTTTEPPTATVTDWSFDECSVVPVPADMRAVIRERAKAARANPTQEATMDPVEAALKVMTDGLAALSTAVRAKPDADMAAKAKREKDAADAAEAAKTEADAKAKREKDAADAEAAKTEEAAKAARAAKQKREGEGEEDAGDGDDDGDGTGGTDEERAAKRARLVKNLDAVLGTRAAPEYRAAVEARLPSRLVRSLAVQAMGTPGKRETLKPSEAEVARQAQGARTKEFVSFGQRGGIGQSAK